MKAVRIHGNDADGLVYEDLPDPQAATGQAVVQLEAIGLNYAEVMARRNAQAANLPAPVGGEAAGTVVAIGDGVTEVKVGDRVAFTGVPGAYAERISAPAARLVPVPAGLTTKQAAAVLLQGMTAHYLAVDTYPLKPGDTRIVHAAAGGVGLLLCQIAKMRGATVIATASSADKLEAARKAGADHLINYAEQDFAAEAMKITNDQGADVIYDSVGQATFLKGFDCLKRRGMMASYGQASGPVAPVDPALLSRGSFYLARAGLAAYTATREELLTRAAEVFDWVASGKLDVHVYKEFALAEAGAAQSALEHRETIGKVLLVP